MQMAEEYVDDVQNPHAAPDAMPGGPGIDITASTELLRWRRSHARVGLRSGGQSIPRIPRGSLAQVANKRLPLAAREREMDIGNVRVPDQHLAAVESDLDTCTGVTPGGPTPRKTIAHYYPHPSHFQG